MLMTTLWLFSFLISFGVLAYHRASLSVWAMALGFLLVFFTGLSEASLVTLALFWLFYALFFIPLLVTPWRQRFLTQPILAFYQKIMPTMSRTEREALNAGTVSWEGDLFRGRPNWRKLLALPQPQLTQEEKYFLENEVETLCGMIDDWDITHKRADLPPAVWAFLKKEGFFGLLIPKEYGGKGFSNFACSQIQIKVQACSVSVGTTVSVPNSLGPAELLLHYGTDEQKAYYLPRLASGEEVPCFALTSPDAGSDATAMTDWGVVCEGAHEGKSVLGVRLNWNKRYITLAPVATVIGLAFKLYDPDHLLGTKEDIGITCALIPRHTPGVTVGRRHLPLSAQFQNGPTQGKDVFIPLDWIIGGRKMAGHGWRMLMECLAGGRAVSLPAVTTGGAKAALFASGAYSRIRKQFKQSIVRFEGVAETLARMAGNLYIMDSARIFTLGALDRGEKPSVASAIIKYHITECARRVGNDAMDIHGGKGIIMGPNNYLGRGYEAIPIAITVEGANILTRNMIIFGQGAIRCHPYVLAEYEAARLKDEKKALLAFDKAIFSHLGFTLSNWVRTFFLGLTGAKLVSAPFGKTKAYFQQATRFSSAFAFLADLCMMVYGGSLKRKESVSARLGDILSNLYLLSAILNRYHTDGCPPEDLPLVRFAGQSCLYKIQQSFDEILRNFPIKSLAYLLKWIIFPFGKRFAEPSTRLASQVAQLFISPTETRKRLTQGLFTTPTERNPFAKLEEALLKTIEAEPIEKIVRKAAHAGEVLGYHFREQAKRAAEKGLISEEQYALLNGADESRQEIIAVDDFEPGELVRA
jgi:acyl-CoA dehydrogenase